MNARNARLKGNRNEHRTMAIFEASGYYCIRSSLSAGIFDVVGIGKTDIVLIQVKTRDWPSSADVEAIQAFCAPPNTRKLLHRYRDRVSLPDVKEIT